MALPNGFLEELRARTPISAVIGRRVRLARSGKNWKGCCPFHGEKTPSFYVYDDHYHCFGCGAHGDAVGFVMQSQGMGFMQAVEQLASEAGLQVPQPTPLNAELERQRLDLAGVLARAEASFQRRLMLPEGRAALTYLHGRGLTDDTIRRFGLGWSGEGRGALAADLARENVSSDQLVDAGLIRRDEETGRLSDLFYNRVMFPIRDRRGRTLSFGGRLMGDGQPKYVNGPETVLFSKRRTLYGLDVAHDAVRGGAAPVVVEGYMDVIALHQAGFTAAVAPLGTALTEEQLEALWRLSPVPVLCFDGDTAGARAAARVTELALPLLSPERSLCFAALPEGEDPDSVLRRHGADAMRGVLEAAKPLSGVLFDMLRQGRQDATPEQRASFRTRLEEAARRIPDKALASEYRQLLLEQFYQSRRRPTAGARAGSFAGGRKGADRQAGFTQRSGAPRPRPSADAVTAERVRILTAILLRHPGLLHDVEHAYAGLDLEAFRGSAGKDAAPEYQSGLLQVRDALLVWANQAEVLDSKSVMDHLTESGLEFEVGCILATVPVPLPICALPDAMPAEAEEGWWHIFGMLNIDQLRREIAEAEAEAVQNMTSETQRRLVALRSAFIKVQSGEPDGAEPVAA